MQKLVNDLIILKTHVESIDFKLVSLRDNIHNVSNQLLEKEQESQNIIRAEQYYKKAIDLIYERSIVELKETLNSALSFIFTDRDFEIDIILNDKRGKSLTLAIKNNGIPVSLKDGMGMGINCVISAILHIYYLQCKGSKILLLDETYHNISAQYITRFFEFLRNLCKGLGFILVLISHDERTIPYADKRYVVDSGNIVELVEGIL